MFMAQDTVLEVEHVSKIYSRRREVTQRRLGGDFWRAVLARPYQPQSTELRPGEFYAVNDVSFSLKRGEAFGIIGLNGSGKTTLLRMLAGQIPPDRGQITVVGRTASMIDLTAGFQPSASGRENVFLRGGALGRSRAEMEASYDDIVAFAELGEAIDAPVASYSSGMTMRLAFSIVAAAAPDIMFIDEVLAVGDFRFRQKCLARVRELREHSAFVMVSHSMVDIARFCDRVLVMNGGTPIFLGGPEEAIKLYESLEVGSTPKALERKRIAPAEVHQKELIQDIDFAWEPANPDGTASLSEGGQLRLKCRFRLLFQPKNLVIGVPVYNSKDELITGFSTDSKEFNLEFNHGENYNITLEIPSFYLNRGIYRSAVGIVDGNEYVFMRDLQDINVSPSADLVWGPCYMPYKWSRSERVDAC